MVLQRLHRTATASSKAANHHKFCDDLLPYCQLLQFCVSQDSEPPKTCTLVVHQLSPTTHKVCTWPP